MIHAALVTPTSGPLALFGGAGAVALRAWAERFSGDLGVRLGVHDAYPDPVAALHRALADRPDLLFGPYGSGPAAAVARATDRLVWNHGGATLGARSTVVNLLSPARTYFDGTVRSVLDADPGVRSAAILHGDTAFGRQVGAGAAATATALGLTVRATTDLSDLPEADLLLVAGRFEDEVAAARRLLPGRWRAAAFVGAGVEEVLAGLGGDREGLLGPAQWIAAAAPEPDEGPALPEFAAAYRDLGGREPPYPAVQAFAAGLVAARCVRDAGGTDDAALRAAALHLDRTTVFGRFALDPVTGAQVGHRVVTVQWQDGARRVVWPPERAQAAVRPRR